MLLQTNAALAQDAASNEAAANQTLKACDLAAASPYDKQRPADVPGVLDATNAPSAAYSTLNPSVSIPPCEAAVRAAPQDTRMLYQLARSYRDAKRFSEALSLFKQAADNGNALAANDLAKMYGKGQGVEVDLKAQLYYIDQAARTGLNVAENDYGKLYERGNAVLPKDEAIARQLVTLAANDNCPPAMNNLGVMLAKGIGGNKDVVEARYWYEKAAQAGNYNAMVSFGWNLKSGIGGEQDYAEARKWFEKSASGNQPLGTNNLGVMARDGLGGPKDLDEARRLFQKAIALGEKQFAAKNLERLDQENPSNTQGAASSDASPTTSQSQAATNQAPTDQAPTNQAATNEATTNGAPSEAAPNSATNDSGPNAPLHACDLAAASAYDKQRPADVPGIAYNAMNAGVAVPACEAAARAAPRNARILYELGRAYNVARRLPESAQYYEQAAAAGSAIAAYNLSRMYEKGSGVEADQQKQLTYLTQAAQAGLGIAAYRMGSYYFVGQFSLARDENQANEWFYRSAEDGYFLGMYRYGMTMQRLSTKPEDAEQAKAWVQSAIDQAAPTELLQLCESLRVGTDGIRDSTSARDVCRKAAIAGNARAMFDYAVLLEDGAGGEQDYDEARRWYEKSATSGRTDAMNAIGVFLQNGRGGDKDLVAARNWFERSADGNNPDGTNSLGVMFERGLGGPQDKEEARRLYSKALDLGEKKFAAINLKRLDKPAPIRRVITIANATNEGAPNVATTEDPPDGAPRI